MLRKRKIFCVLLQLFMILPVLLNAQVLPFQTVTYDDCQLDFRVIGIFTEDLDGDDDSDMLIFRGDHRRGFSVILNNGNNDFELSDTYEPNRNAGDYQLTDVNEDGCPDLFYYIDRQELLYYQLNNGEGGFEPVDTLLLDSMIYDYNFFDVTGDERKDLLLRFPRSVHYRENLGDGNFGETQYFASHFPQIILDVNQDGEFDFLQPWGGVLRLFMNRGNLNFELADTVLTGIGNFSPGHELVDIDGDNDLDIIFVSRSDTNYLICLINEGDGSFGLSCQNELKHSTRRMFLTNINNDEHSDIAVEHWRSISTYTGNGDGTFDFQREIYTSDWETSTVLDLDSNGFGDIITPFYYTDSITMLLNNGNGFYNGEYFEIYPALSSRAKTYQHFIDFDSDGDPDIVQASRTADGEILEYRWSSQLALNDGHGNYEIVDSLLSFESEGSSHLSSYSSILVDFTGDQRADWVIRDVESPNILRLYESNEHFQFEEIGSIDVAGEQRIERISIVDFDNDGDQDLIAGVGGAKIKLWHNYNNGEFVLTDSIAAGGQNYAYHFTDINNDGSLDFISARDCTEVFGILNDGNGFFGENSFRLTLENGISSYGISSGNLNFDNLTDLIITGKRYNNVHIFIQTEDAEFVLFHTLPATGIPHVCDVDQDGDSDIILSSNLTTVLLNDGNANFQIENTYAFGHSNLLSIADYNGDGELDLVKAGDGGIYYTYPPREWNQVQRRNALPSDFEILFAYPNPFNSSFHLNYKLNTPGQVGVKVFDLRGRVLYNHDKLPLVQGSNTISIDGSNWATGAYFVNVEVGEEAQTLRVHCLK